MTTTKRARRKALRACADSFDVVICGIGRVEVVRNADPLAWPCRFEDAPRNEIWLFDPVDEESVRVGTAI